MDKIIEIKKKSARSYFGPDRFYNITCFSYASSLVFYVYLRLDKFKDCPANMEIRPCMVRAPPPHEKKTRKNTQKSREEVRCFTCKHICCLLETFLQSSAKLLINFMFE